MKKLLLMFFACMAFTGTVFAAVDLNRATRAQLESVKGIGPAKAKAIIDYRTKHGPFKSVDELDKVTGFGGKTVDKVRAGFTVSIAAEPVKAAGKGKPAGKGKEAPVEADKK